MTDDTNNMQRLQNGLLHSAGSCFTEREQDNLRCLIRITCEFETFLRAIKTAASEISETEYNVETTFSGIDAFVSVSHAYRILVGALPSNIGWDSFLLDSFRRKYLTKFEELSKDGRFENRCRLLLDIFKMQLVFAGISYG
jgi:hypothetical protein